MVRYKKLHVDNLLLSNKQKELLKRLEDIRIKLNYQIKNIDWKGFQIVYLTLDKVTVQISLINKTVTTNIYHPKLKFTTKIRKNCNDNDIIGILASPRIHLNKQKTKIILNDKNRKTSNKSTCQFLYLIYITYIKST